MSYSMDFVTRTLQPFRSSGSLRNAGSAGMPILMESILALKQQRGVILRRDANSGMRQDLGKAETNAGSPFSAERYSNGM